MLFDLEHYRLLSFLEFYDSYLVYFLDDTRHGKQFDLVLESPLDEEVKVGTFAGKQVFVVDSDTYHECRLGKKQYARYEKYVGKNNVGLAIREYGLKFPKRPIILQNGENGPMLYLRYGRS